MLYAPGFTKIADCTRRGERWHGWRFQTGAPGVYQINQEQINYPGQVVDQSLTIDKLPVVKP